MTESSNTCDIQPTRAAICVIGWLCHSTKYLRVIMRTTETLSISCCIVPIRHQTATYVSSIDPWHSAADLAEHEGDQTGLDLFYTSGITNHLPAMIPISMLYGTPEDAAAQIAYSNTPLSHLLRRDGRGARRPVHAAGRLRCSLSSVRHCDSQGGSGAETRRTSI